MGPPEPYARGVAKQYGQDWIILWADHHYEIPQLKLTLNEQAC